MARGYALIRRIAGGGMGEVFVARLTGTDNFEKRVALKLLLPHLSSSSELVSRFHEEARLAARMHHPNIVEIFDVGEADGRPFIAMQLVDGVTLSQLLRDLKARGERLSLPMARLIAIGLCEALTYAHTLTDGQQPLNVVHRDVTPSNVLVSRNGAVLLTDFGIARVRDTSSITNPGVLRGKVAYLAPEQFLYDAPVDARVDIYSAGLTMYEALTGTSPYKRDSVGESIAAVKLGEVPRIETIREDVTAGIAQGVHRAIARQPSERFSTAREMREAFSDGQVATAPELADYVRRVCGEGLPLEDSADVPGTQSVLAFTHYSGTKRPDGPPEVELEGQTEIYVPPPEPKRTTLPTRIALALALTTVVLLVTYGVTWLREEPGAKTQAVASETEVAVSPPPPEPTPPAPTVESAPEENVMVVELPELPDETEPAKPPLRRPKALKRPPKALVSVAPSPAKLGYLTVDASPWADVLLGGKLLDRTPFVRRPLPAGRYTLVFRAPDGTTQVRDVAVAEGETTAVRVNF